MPDAIDNRFVGSLSGLKCVPLHTTINPHHRAMAVNQPAMTRMGVFMRTMLCCAAVFCSVDLFASYVIPDSPRKFRSDAKKLDFSIDVVSRPDRPDKGLSENEVTRSEFSNVVARVSAMRCLTSLRMDVRLDSPGLVFDVAPFEGLTNLTELAIGACHEDRVVIRNLDRLAALPIGDLSLKFVSLEDCEAISRLAKLSDFATTSLAMARHVHPDIGSLCLQDVRSEGVIDLSRFRRLESLTVYDARCERMTGVFAMRALEKLTICGPFLFDEEEIAKCKSLKSLDIYCPSFGKAIRSTSFLAGLPLTSLGINGAPVREIAGLEGCPLTDLEIRECPIRDIDSICRIPTLKSLDLRDTSVGYVDMKAVASRFPNLDSFECWGAYDGWRFQISYDKDCE